MKTKQISIIIILFLMIPVCRAQFFDAGLKLGLVSSQIDGDGYAGYDKLGLDIGAYVNYHITQRAALQLELEYIQKGSSHNPNYENGDVTQYLLRVNYIQLPVLWYYRLNRSFSFETGPAFGVLMGDYEETNQYSITPNPFRKFSLSYQVGLNYNISHNFKANIRIDYSLMSIRQYNPFGEGRYILFQWGEFSNAIILSVQYIIKHADQK